MFIELRCLISFHLELNRLFLRRLIVSHEYATLLTRGLRLLLFLVDLFWNILDFLNQHRLLFNCRLLLRSLTLHLSFEGIRLSSIVHEGVEALLL